MHRPLFMMFASVGLALTACSSSTSQSTAEIEQSLVARGCEVDSSPRACDPNDDKKTTVCHVPPGNPANAHTICVGNPSVEAHLAHGDILGTCDCPGEPEPEPEPCETSCGGCPDSGSGSCPDGDGEGSGSGSGSGSGDDGNHDHDGSGSDGSLY